VSTGAISFYSSTFFVMCGIAGICHISSADGISPETIGRMIDVVEHRGPDETGIYLDDNVGLGHARLSIIDLSSGTQPIHNEDQTMWIVYNGEVYNYPELRADLSRKGHRFYTTSDTEVLVHLYEEYGPDCLARMNGQFAFAIWDAAKKQLFLARDRVGIRPLHYTIQNGELIFASEIKSIFANKNVPRRIDPLAMDQIFTFWTTLPGTTTFKNVLEVPPGHYLKVANGQVLLVKYWDLPFYPRDEHLRISPDEISERIQQLLLEAVRIRLRADVPVGAYLSGGLDSSGVTTLIVRNFNSDVRTFGIRFEEPEFDEGRHQSDMVSFLEANHGEIHASNEKIGAALADCLWHTEKPLLRTAPVPLLLLSRLVRDSGLKVVLTGEGGDEVFGGYNIFREAKVRSFWARKPDSDRRAALITHLYPYIFDDPRLNHTLRSFFARGLEEPNEPLFSHMVRWANTSKLKTFFSAELKEQIGSYDGCEQVRQNLPAAYPTWDCVSKAQYLEMHIFLSNYLLSSQGDRVAMANSVEIRLPYLDPNIMEFMGHVPSKWKILGLNEKYVLKKSFQRILPESITTRSKHPYRAPIKQSLLNGKTSRYVDEFMSPEAIGKTGLFHVGRVKSLLDKLRRVDAPGESDNMALVGILSSQLVHHKFVENFSDHRDCSSSADLIVDRRSAHSKCIE